MSTALTKQAGRRGRLFPAETVRQEIETLCRSLTPGDRIPTHTELMRRFGGSERTVLQALDALQRDGQIVRKNGIGTFVADRAPLSRQRELATTIIAVTPPDHAYFKYCTEILFDQARERGLTIECHFVDEANPVLPVALESGPVPGGFLLFHHRLEPIGVRLWEQGHRVVVLGVPPAGVHPRIPCVHADHELSGYFQIRRLLDAGHRRLLIAHTDGELRETVRWQGHQRAIGEAQRRHGISATIRVVQGDEWAAWLIDPERVSSCFSAPDAPTGLIAWNDHVAARLLGLLNRCGISVPEDVSLIGCDSLPEGTLVHPAITTIDNAIDRLIHAALDLLTRAEHPPSPVVMTTVPTVIERDSIRDISL
ncbi:MAG: substrate-binding domain-containing protein [Fibrella sp.]|nr:substrate-binding domain-containing protein [Armatimonadota bacterium]